MNTNLTIRLGNAQMDVAQRLGTDNGKAVNELVAVSIEAAHDDLATKEFVRAEVDKLRQSFDNKFWILIGLMISGFAGLVYAMMTLNATIVGLVK